MARLRYNEILRELDPERKVDRNLRAEVTRTLRAIDRKIADCGDSRPGGATGAGLRSLNEKPPPRGEG